MSVILVTIDSNRLNDVRRHMKEAWGGGHLNQRMPRSVMMGAAAGEEEEHIDGSVQPLELWLSSDKKRKNH